MKIRRLQRWISEQLFGHSLKIAVGTALVLNFAITDASAQTWTNTSSGNWSVGTNWDGGIAPTSASTTALTFGGTTDYTATNNVGTGTFSLNRIDISGSGIKSIAPNVAANTLTFGGATATAGITMASDSGATTISNGVIYSVSSTVTNNSSNLLSLSGAQTFGASTTTTYSGSGNVTAGASTGTSVTFGNNSTIINSGSGTLALADGGTYVGSNVTVNLSNTGTGQFTIGDMAGVSGTLNINAGTVKFAGASVGDLFGAALTLNVASGATFDLAGNGETMGAISGTGTITGAALGMQLTGNRTWGGVFAGAGTFSTGVAGVNYTFTGNNTSTGTTTIVAGSSLSLGNGGTAGTVGGAITNNGSLTINRSGTYTYGGAISGSGTLTITGGGTTTLSGTNAYTGSTTVSAGTLAITTAASLPSNTSAVTVAPGAALDVSAVAGGYTFIAGRTVTLGRTTTPANDLIGSASFDGILNIGGTNTAATATISADTTFNAATFQFDLNNIPGSGNDRVAVGGNLTLTGTNSITVNKFNGNLTSGIYTLFTYAGTLTGNSSNLSVIGAGGGRQSATIVDTSLTPGSVQLAVSGAPANLTWAGNIGSNVWNLETNENFTGAVDNRFFNDDAVTFNDTGVGGATPVLVAGALSPSSFTVAGSQNYTFNDGGSGSISGTGNIFLNSTGTVTLGVPVTTVGTTTLTAGTLTVATGGSIAGPVTISNTGTVMQIGNGGTSGEVTGPIALAVGTTLAFNRSDAPTLNSVITGSGNIVNNGTGEVTLTTEISSGNYDLAGSGKLILSGNITGSTVLTKSGPGTLQLSGTNSFTSDITVNAGTLELGAVATAGALGKTISLANNTTLRIPASYSNTGTTGNVFSLADNSTVTLDIPSTGSMTVRGNYLIGPLATLNKIGSGQLSVGNGGTSNVGTINVNEGILRVTSNRLADVNDINISAGAQFLISDNGALSLPVEGSYSFSGNGPNNTGALRLTATANTVVTTIPSPVTLTGDSMINVDPAVGATGAIVLSGNVSGPGGIIKVGVGALQLTGANNTYGGPTIIRDGALQIAGGNNRIPVTSSLTLGDDINNTSGAFDLNGNNQTVAGLATAGTGTANTVGNTGSGTPTFTVALASGSQTFAGLLGGGFDGFNFAKSGSGTLILSGTNTYTGSTVVNEGTLAIGSAASLPTSTGSVAVASGAVLDVSGVAGGYSFGTGRTVTLGRTGTPAPDLVGSAAIDGTLNIGGTNTAATATISGALTLNATTVNFDLSNSLASGNDLVNIVGNLTATGTTTIFVNQTGSSLAQGTYTLFTYGGTLTGDDSNFVLAGSVSSSGTRATYDIITSTPGPGPGSVQLSVVGTAANLTWVGNATNNVWDLTTTGYFTGAADTKFYNSDSVTFSTSGVGDSLPVTINSPLAPANVTVTGTKDYTFSGTGSIATGTLTKDGTAALTLNVPVASGSTAVNSGSLTVGAGGSISGPVAITGGTLNGNVAGAVNGPLTISGGIANGTVDGAFNGSVAINGGTFIALNPTGSAVNGGSISVSGSGILQIGNGGTDGNITGSIVLATGGTLNFNRSDAVSDATGLTISGNATINNQGAGLVTRSTTIAVGQNTLTLGGTGNITLGNVVSGTGQIIKNDTGTVTLLADNDAFTGTVTINNGMLALDDLGAGGDISASLITVNNSGKFLFGPNGNPDFPNSTFIAINGGEAEFMIGENYGATKITNNGTLRLTGDGTIGRDVTSAAAVGDGPFVGFELESGSIISTNTGAGTGSLTGSATAPMTKTTSGTVAFTGPITYAATMPINLRAGVLDFQAANLPANAGTGVFTLGDTATNGTLRLSGSTSASTARTFAIANGGGTIEVSAADATLTLTGSVTATGTGQLTKTGPGTLALTGANTYAGGTTINSGTLQVGTGGNVGTGPVNNNASFDVARSGLVTAAITGTGTTSVTTAGASLTASSIRQGTLNIGAGNTVTVAANGTNTGVSRVSNLSINATGQLDLKDNDLVIGNSSIATVQALITSGAYSGTNGYFDGPGITSSTAANDPTFRTALGFASNADLGYTNFGGLPVLGSDILIKYTYYGDTDLSGAVDGDDFTNFLFGFQNPGNGTWLYGDFDYSGSVDGDDFVLFLDAFQNQGGSLLMANNFQATYQSVSAVPEPGTYALLSLSGLALAAFARRRRVQQQATLA